jgi:hypothetical protein
VAATFEKAITYVFAGRPFRNAEFSGADWSVDLDLIDKQMRGLSCGQIVSRKNSRRGITNGKEQERTGNV